MSSSPPTGNFTFLPQGAIVQEFMIHGQNIVLSFPKAEHYAGSLNSCYFGETIGRTTNRIKNATIESLNGKSYELSPNDDIHSLHGGHNGWGKKVFSGPEPVNRNGKEAVKFTYVSPDGEEGYPGTVELRVWYTAWEEKENDLVKVVLEMEYEVELVGSECEETVVGVTNHGYFNLSNLPTLEGTQVCVSTNEYLPIDDGGIPLGHIAPYPGIEAEKPFILGKTEPDLDDCFIINSDPATIPLDTRSQPLKRLAEISHPLTRLHLEVLSTEPAFQLYTGKYIDVEATEGSPARSPRAGMCIEPSRYVNAVNVPEWRGMVVLGRGSMWGSRSVYRAWQA